MITNSLFDLPFLSSSVKSSLLTGLAAFWSMNEASGTRADSSGNGHSMLDVNSNISTTPGVIGNSALLSQTSASNALSAAANSVFNGGAGKSLSFAGFFKGNGYITNSPVVSNWSSGSTGFLTWIDSGNFEFRAIELGTLTPRVLTVASVASLGTSVFHHIACGYDTSLQQIWYQLDGGTRTSTACADIVIGNNDLCCGNYDRAPNSANQFAVNLLGFWTRSITTAEVAHLYNSGSGKNYPF